MKEHLRQLAGGHEPLRGRNIAREYLQARILGALQRAGAMTSLAFHGGTSLRFLFGLPRYSEDLDFALEGEPSRYDLRRHLRAVRAELSGEGYRVELRMREHRAVHSAFVCFPGTLYEIGLSPHPGQVLAVKIEVDTNSPPGAVTGTTLVRRHETLRLFHHDRASLLAGKLHAVLQRPYTKGRDIYDLVWYLSDPGLAAAEPRVAERGAAADRLVGRGDDACELAPCGSRAAGAPGLESRRERRAAVSRTRGGRRAGRQGDRAAFVEVTCPGHDLQPGTLANLSAGAGKCPTTCLRLAARRRPSPARYWTMSERRSSRADAQPEARQFVVPCDVAPVPGSGVRDGAGREADFFSQPGVDRSAWSKLRQREPSSGKDRKWATQQARIAIS